MLYEKTSKILKGWENDKMNEDKIIFPAQSKLDTGGMAECRFLCHFMQKHPMQWSSSWGNVEIHLMKQNIKPY